MYTDEYDVELAGFFDSDQVGNPNDERLTLGYAFNIGSGVMSWSSKKQPTISLPSKKSEYKSLSSETCEVVWFKRIIKDVDEKKK